MGIWYKCEKKNMKYFKFILFNSGKIKIVKNDSINKINRIINLFEDGANFLDAFLGLNELASIELAKLTIWIIDEY